MYLQILKPEKNNPKIIWKAFGFNKFNKMKKGPIYK